MSETIKDLTDVEIQALLRGTVRYACYRQRSGNPEPEHTAILNWYKPRVEAYGLVWAEFGDSWDISKDNNLDIVSGHIVHLYKEENKSLFDAAGNLKA